MVGQSLGTGVCVDYCAKTGWVDPVILISPYKSLVRVIADSCISTAVDSSFNTIEKIPDLKCPVKILHGEQDTLINVSHGREIYDKLSDKTFDPVWFPTAGHNNILERITFEHIGTVFS